MKLDKLGSDSATDLSLGSLPFSCLGPQKKQQDAYPRVTQVSDFLFIIGFVLDLIFDIWPFII